MKHLLINIITTLICSAGLLFYLFNRLKIYKLLKFKPFTCEPCLAFWIGIIMFFVPFVLKSIIISATFTFFLYIILKKAYDD